MWERRSQISGIQLVIFESHCYSSIPLLSLSLSRQLFAEAEAEQKKMGINSALHIIIFDELDAICKQRGTVVSRGGGRKGGRGKGGREGGRVGETFL